MPANPLFRPLMLKSLLAVLAALVLVAPAMAQSDPNRLFADSKVVVRDRFSDEIVGKGRDVVFIPGLASSRATWKATAERLKGKYRLHLIQIAGFSGEPARANATGEVFVPTAEAIDAYLVEQKLSPATVVGHSLGGTMILYLAQKHPEHLKAALAVDSLPFFGAVMMGPQATVERVKPMATQMRQGTLTMDGPAYQKMMQPQVDRMVTSPEHRKMVMDWSLVSDRSAVGNALYDDLLLDLRPGMSAITTPIVLVYPDNVPAGAVPGMAAGLYAATFAAAKTVRLQEVAGANHFVMLDQPKAFADLLDAFLAR